MKTREKGPINANSKAKCLFHREMEITQMAKRNVVDITLPHGVTLKVDKLADRTIRTVKVGDYLPTSLRVRGVTCDFYARVTEVVGSTVHTVFGSENRAHSFDVFKGEKVNVYRPI